MYGDQIKKGMIFPYCKGLLLTYAIKKTNQFCAHPKAIMTRYIKHLKTKYRLFIFAKAKIPSHMGHEK